MPHGEGQFSTVIARLFVGDPRGLYDFLVRVFGATGEFETERPSILQIGDSTLMVSDVSARPGTSSCLYVHVDDLDATYARALELGATAIETPQEVPWGGRRAIVRDAWNNDWQIAGA